MSDAPEPRNPLDRLAEEFAERLRRGEHPDIEQYAAAHPALASEIRELLPALLLLEDLAPAARETSGASTSVVPGAVPTTLGGYRILAKLGHGGMGTVHAAERTSPGAADQPIVVKLIHPHLVEHGDFQERFLREAEIGHRVEHENVVRTLAAGIHEGADGRVLPYLVLERVEGRTLDQLAGSLGGLLPEALLRQLALQVARGLEAIHARGIVHRDLKPANIMVTDDHRVRIMDLGVARIADEADGISATHQFVGSVRYAAPEQFGGGRAGISAGTDLYSLGVTLFELATGRHPFTAAGPSAMMLAHLTQAPSPARIANPDLTPLFAELIDTLLAKDPADRLGSAGELAQLLLEGENSEWWASHRMSLDAPPMGVPHQLVHCASQLVGRGQLLARLERASSRAQEGVGQVILLGGEAGIGKSRVVRELAESLTGEEVFFLYGSFPPAGETSGIREALADCFGKQRVVSSLARYLPDVPELLPAFAAYLLQDSNPSGAVGLDAAQLHAMYAHLLRALARRRPVVWVVDDLHFAPHEELRLFLALARVVAGKRVLLLGTSRTGLPPDIREGLLRLTNLEEIELDRLSRAEGLELVAAALGSAEWMRPLAERIVTESDGNPFFVLEMIHQVRRERDSGTLGPTSRPDSEAIRRLLIPPAVRDLVELRLRAVPETDRPILECAALQGFEFEAHLVAAALGRDSLEVLQALGVLERKSGLVRSAGDHHRFDHHQVQEVLVDTMAPPLARAYHSRLAREAARRSGVDLATATPAEGLPGKQAELIASHALQGGEDELGLAVVDAAILHQNRRFAPEEAWSLCSRALACDLQERPQLRATLLSRRCKLSSLLGRPAEHARDVRAALAAAEETGDPSTRIGAYLEMGAFHQRRGERTQSVSWYQRALALAEESGHVRYEHVACLRLAHFHGTRSSYADAIEMAERARTLAATRGDDADHGNAHFSLGNILFLAGRYSEALLHLDSCLELLDGSGPVSARGRMRALGTQGNINYTLGRYPEAQASYESSLAMARHIGDREATIINLNNVAGVELAVGRLGAALELYEQTLELSREIGVDDRLTNALANLGAGLLAAGRPEQARTWIEQALAVATRRENLRMQAFALHDRALLALHAGDFAEARVDAQRSLEIRTRTGTERLAESQLLLGLVELAVGERRAARELMVTAEAAGLAVGERGSATRAAAHLAALGDRDPGTVEMHHGMARLDEAEVRLLLHSAGAPGQLALAREILALVEESLPDEAARTAFRERAPVSRLLTRVTG